VFYSQIRPKLNGLPACVSSLRVFPKASRRPKSGLGGEGGDDGSGGDGGDGDDGGGDGGDGDDGGADGGDGHDGGADGGDAKDSIWNSTLTSVRVNSFAEAAGLRG